MIDMRLGWIGIGLCWVLSLVAQPAAAEGYSIGAMPDWARPAQVPSSDWMKGQNPASGVAYLLVDRQWNLARKTPEYYGHFVTQALTASGVGEVSQIAIEFDPMYETLTLHRVAIIRDGVSIDRLDRARISLIQRERELENQLYDGSKTLNVIIEDVRPGDAVEYGFSIRGANPIFAGRFSKTLNTQWSVPVGGLHYRLLWPASTPLQLRNYLTDAAPQITPGEGLREYVWRAREVEALVKDKDTPDWYQPYGKLFISDMADWNEVVSWALPLYREITPPPPSLQALIDRLREEADTDEARVLLALRFVQEQIRYLGIEIGVNSHKPSAPDVVVDRRYGDCKDKSRLLAALLKGLGIEADAALVNTESGALMAKRLPTPAAFNHVIVRVRLNGVDYWLDPTLTYQKGSLKNLYQPDYDYALVVSKTAGGLMHMSEDIHALHSKTVEETFDLTHDIEVPASYSIVTRYDRYYADSMREELADTNLSALQQSYLNYTARYYPSVETAEHLSVSDDEDGNSITVTEHYRIPGVWQSGDDARYLTVNFEPFLIDDHVQSVDTPKRSAPYAVTHPVRYRHTTRIQVPRGSSFENEYHQVLDSAFRFSKRVEFDNDQLLIEYLYESLADHVNAQDIAQHSRHIRELRKLSIYQIQMPNPSLGTAQERFDGSDINWFMVTVTGFSCIVLLGISVKYIYRYDPPYRAPAQVNRALEGLSGWLILPAISLLLTPLRVAWESRELLYVFSAFQWSILVDQYSTEFLTLIVLEVVSNIAMILFCLFLIPLFFTRRHTFPRLYILYSLFVLAVSGADLLALHLLQVPGLKLESTDVALYVRLLFYTTIWVLYFIRSQRVKATFTRCLRDPACSRQAELPARA